MAHVSNNSETGKKEQIISECFAKTLHIILEARCPYVSSRNYSGEQGLSSPASSSSSSSSSVRSRDKWFNLVLKDCPAAPDKIDFWRQSNLEPMVVDVVLVQRASNGDLLNSYAKTRPARTSSGSEFEDEKIIERWVLQYETKKTSNNAGKAVPFSRRAISTSTPTLYKKAILLLRSLYVTIRLLPAYKLFRDLVSSARIRTYYLCHHVSSFVEPFTRREEAGMQRFVFDPVETSCGRLCLSVLYCSSLLNLITEPSKQMTHQFIPDYVGSPLAEPLKRFPPAPQPQGYPSFSPFGRRHSWNDLYRGPPHSGIPSPSPTNSESKPHSLGLPPTVPPQVMVKNPGYEEYWPSPNFSPSFSPSPPTNSHNKNISNVLMRCESAPDSIPMTRPFGIHRVFNNQILPPYQLHKFTKSNVTKAEGHLNVLPTCSNVDKLLQFGKDEAEKLSGVRTPSHSSPFSRCSSRLSFQDDYDDSEYFSPFVVDDEDPTDSGSRGGGCSFEQVGMCDSPREFSYFRRSGDAAVGAVVSMLQRASPLRQDFETKSGNNYTADSNRNSQAIASASASASSSSGLSSSKTTEEALEELRGYREMKSLLLKKR